MAELFTAPDYAGDFELIERDGFTLTAKIEADPHMGPPWEEHDGHGVVSDWTTRAKRPGELVLVQDRNSRRYYDFAETCRIARKDGWGSAGDEHLTGQTAAQKAAKAARADFERMRAWCKDDWYWVGVVVTAERGGLKLGHASLWGIESDSDGSYFAEVANDLTDEALEAAKAKLGELCTC